jgi:acyl-coenzyme A thioesterase PaaI-like protein
MPHHPSDEKGYQPVDSSAYRAMLAFAAAPADAAGGVHLSTALRRLNSIVAASSATDRELDEIASMIDELTDRLGPSAEASRYPLGERLGGRTGIFVNHPVIGALNPCAPTLVVVPDGDRLVGTATYGTPFEGPPGCVHGGHVAAGFDSMVVMTAGINGLAGVTRSLTIRYRKLAPLRVPLTYEGEVDSRRDKSTTVHVVLRHEDAICAQCTGDVATGLRSQR